jgi:hypothetical protein
MMYLGLLSSDPNWEHVNRRHVGITRRFILSMALLSIASVILLLPLVQIGLAVLTPMPFEYRGLPFQICAPGSTTETCLPLAAQDSFRPGDVVPFVVNRCTAEPFAQGAYLPYVLSRNVVNVTDGTRIILPSLATQIPSSGCATSVTAAHQLPDSLSPGRYYLEGVATVYGRFRVVNAYYYTEPFDVRRVKETP